MPPTTTKALTTTQNPSKPRPQTPDWIKYVDPLVEKLVGHYVGSREEQTAQAMVDMMDKQVEKYQLSSQLLGGFLLYVKARRLYKHLGYDSMEQFISSEKIGGIGRTQAYKLMKVAMFTMPPNTLTAPTLAAPVLNAQAGRLLMTPDFVSRIGTERAYAITQRWDKESPEGRQELLDAAEQEDNKGFYNRAYGDESKVSFDVAGDDIMLWQDDVGIKVAELVTLDPVLRSTVLDRLNTVPRARL